jgi:hypothetical protein
MANINGNLQHGHLCRKQPILLVRFCQEAKLIFFEIKGYFGGFQSPDLRKKRKEEVKIVRSLYPLFNV